MPWILLACALALLLVAFKTTSVGLLLACLAIGFLLMLAGVVQLLARRVSSRSRDEGLMLDPAELERLRQHAGGKPADNLTVHD